jgi:hypothetical protein
VSIRHVVRPSHTRASPDADSIFVCIRRRVHEHDREVVSGRSPRPCVHRVEQRVGRHVGRKRSSCRERALDALESSPGRFWRLRAFKQHKGVYRAFPCRFNRGAYDGVSAVGQRRCLGELVGGGLPQHPMDADDHHRGVNAEVLAAGAGVGDMVVAELQHQPRPAAGDALDTRAPHTGWKFQTRSTSGASSDVQTMPPPSV